MSYLKCINEVGVKELFLEEISSLYRSMLMTASDLSAITKPWKEQKRVSLTFSLS